MRVASNRLALVIVGASAAVSAAVTNGLVQGRVEHWAVGVVAVAGAVAAALHIYPPGTPPAGTQATAPTPMVTVTDGTGGIGNV